MRPIHSRPRQDLLLAILASTLSVGSAAPASAAATETARDQAGRPRAAVLLDGLEGLDADLARALASDAEAAGYVVDIVDAAWLCEAGRLSTSRHGLLVVPFARTLPEASAAPIEAFLREGGDLLALGLPAWSSASVRLREGWITRERIAATIAAQEATSSIIRFAEEDLSRWHRGTDAPATLERHEVLQDAGGGAGSGGALHVTVASVTGWDTLSSPRLTSAFPPGQTLTCLRARGGPRTRQLALEWIEEDGSRWIATIDLTTSWRSYALPPSSFRAWQPPAGRGGPSDRFDPRRAARLSVGLALTHTALEGGPQEYWVEGIGAAPSPLEDLEPPGGFVPPRLEGLSPGYRFYPCSDAPLLESPGRCVLVSPVSTAGPPGASSAGANPISSSATHLLALHPRPRGVGLDKERTFRFEPLLEAKSASDEHRGAVGALLVHGAGPLRSAALAVFTPGDPTFYARPEVRTALRETLRRLRGGILLSEGGSDRYTVFPGDPLRLGARVINAGVAPAEATVRLTFADPSASAPPLVERQWRLRLEPGAEERVESAAPDVTWPDGGLRVEVQLMQGSELFDRLEHEVHALRLPAQPSFIEARAGGLWLDGKPWKAHGVNYMPSSGIGLDAWKEFELWLDREAYDPQVIDRDLGRIAGLGMNAVSIFVYRRSLEAGNLLDFLRLARKHGLHVNQSLRPGTPMEFRWQDIRELIEGFRLAGNDTILAYDLAWEPSHFDERHQRGYAPLWRRWIEHKHGDVTAAEAAWGVPAPREQGEVTVPPPRLLLEDGDHRGMVADYRRFLDELVSERYAEARRLVRSIDPRHPVSFRMQLAGDPTHRSASLLPYDFKGLSGAVDIWEPEAYGRIGDWERVKVGRFTAAYARLCDREKPVVWAEAGYDIWDRAQERPGAMKAAFAARFYEDFYRLLRESGASGIFFWWYPGGYRVNEASDYGILEPDGTDRAITEVIRREGPRYLAAPPEPAPDVWIEVDRDRDARGLAGIYEAAHEAYWGAIAAGKVPGLRWSAWKRDR